MAQFNAPPASAPVILLQTTWCVHEYDNAVTAKSNAVDITEDTCALPNSTAPVFLIIPINVNEKRLHLR